MEHLDPLGMGVSSMIPGTGELMERRMDGWMDDKNFQISLKAWNLLFLSVEK